MYTVSDSIITAYQQQKFNFYLLTYFSIKYLPRVVVITLFLLDVFYYNILHYFYMSLPFLILPLLLRYFIYICFKHHESTISKLDETLLIYNVLEYDNPNNTEELIMIKIPEYLNVMISYHLKGEKNPFKDDIGTINTSLYYGDTVYEKEQALYSTPMIAERHYIQLLYNTEKIHIVRHFVKERDKFYELIYNLILFSCYFIGWFYILIHIMINIFPEYLIFIPLNYDPFSDLYR